MSASGSTSHSPLPPAATEELGDRLIGAGRCAFVTGGPRDYLPGMSCVAKRLDRLRSRYPVLTMVEEEDADYMRAHAHRHGHRDSMVLPWRRFPVSASKEIGLRTGRVMDKINLLGLPARRLVWIDADMYVRRNIDELCELPDDIDLAAAFNRGGAEPPSYLWPDRHHNGRYKACLAKFDRRQDLGNYTYLRPAQLTPDCPWIFNTGCAVLTPLSARAFNAELVRPMLNASIDTYDGSDQGILNTLLWGARRLWGARYAILHPRYNVIGSQAAHAARGGLEAALVHHTGHSGRPWLRNVTRARASGTPMPPRAEEWHEGCGEFWSKELYERAAAAEGGAAAQDVAQATSAAPAS